MLAKDDALSMFHAWLLCRGFCGSTANVYKSGLRLVLTHLGAEVTQESVDETFRLLKPSSRYSNAKRAWALFEEYAKEKGATIPSGPGDGRVRGKAALVPMSTLPPDVLEVVEFLIGKIGLTCEQITRMYWSQVVTTQTPPFPGAVEFPHPNKKKGHFVTLRGEHVAILKDWATPTENTPLIPFEPGSTIPYPLELILSGRPI